MSRNSAQLTGHPGLRTAIISFNAWCMVLHLVLITSRAFLVDDELALERKTSVGMAVTRAFGDSHRPWWRRPSFYGFRGSVHEFYYKLSHGSAYAMILDRDILLGS
jgi:hypothetical protein